MVYSGQSKHTMAWDPELLTDQANDSIQRTSSSDPNLHPWGLFAWGDAPPACGGGVGAFQWFNSLDEVLTWVTDLSPAAFMTFDEEDEWLEFRTGLRQSAQGFHANPEQGLKQFNTQLKGLLQIDWIGAWPDLVSGPGSYPQKIRQHFREDWDDENPAETTMPIRPEELAEFREFVAGYGM
jgi:hypothetical protein